MAVVGTFEIRATSEGKFYIKRVDNNPDYTFYWSSTTITTQTNPFNPYNTELPYNVEKVFDYTLITFKDPYIITYKKGGITYVSNCIFFVGANGMNVYITAFYPDETGAITRKDKSGGENWSTFRAIITDNVKGVESFGLNVSATNTDSVTINGNPITSFPKTVSISGESTMNIVGKNPNHAVTITNKNNLKSVKIDDTTYNNFPVAVTIGADKTLEISGKDTPEITVNYTNTKPPVISNT